MNAPGRSSFSGSSVIWALLPVSVSILLIIPWPGPAPSAQGQFKTESGWVGVTTYIDTHGNYRVKQEVMVAMSGITTGSIDYYTEGS